MTVMLPKDLQNSLRDKILKLTADHKVRLALFYLLLFGLPNLLAFSIGSGRDLATTKAWGKRSLLS